MPATVLIGAPASPFAARVLIQAYEKGLDLRVQPPPDGMGSAAHLAFNPFGKIPVLLVDGVAIIESAAIQEYLEDVHPTPSLRGGDPVVAGRIRALVRAVDLYLFPVLADLRLIKTDSETRTEQLDQVEHSLHTVLEKLAALCDDQGYLCGGALSLADCTLIPACFYTGFFLARHGRRSPFTGRPRFQAWLDRVNGHDSVRKVMASLEQAAALRS